MLGGGAGDEDEDEAGSAEGNAAMIADTVAVIVKSDWH